MNTASGTRHLARLALLALAGALAGGVATAGEITLAWAPSSDEATIGYDVEVLDAFDQVLEVIDAGVATSHTVTGLDDGVRYRFRIRPYDVNGRRAREASAAIETLPAPRIEALEGIPVPGEPTTVTLSGVNFDPAARILSRRAGLKVGDASVLSTGAAEVTLLWDGRGEPPAAGDLTVVNPVRKAEPYFAAHPEVLDVDASGAVDAADLAQVQAAFGARRGEPGYEDRLDVNGDGVIGGEDVAPIRARLTGRPGAAEPGSRRSGRADRF
ncbi:MAG: hypothetical protein D6738_07330 [Acidobacteria bacterium]|nr:MAG: hypothetical protein D6738_07330 [Acidobacteriota bacterium]